MKCAWGMPSQKDCTCSVQTDPETQIVLGSLVWGETGIPGCPSVLLVLFSGNEVQRVWGMVQKCLKTYGQWTLLIVERKHTAV